MLIYGIGFDSCSEFSLPDSTMGKNVITFRGDMSSSVHIDNKGKDILILGKRLTQGLDDNPLTAETKHPIIFTQSEKRFVLSLHYHDATASYLLMLKNYVNLKQKRFQKIL